MSNILADGHIQQLNTTEKMHWEELLSHYVFVDIGVITTSMITAAGTRATVKAYRLDMNQQVTYNDVEVVLPGNLTGGFSAEFNEAPCILFGPYSSSLAIGNELVDSTSMTPYDSKHYKCMPIGSPSLWTGKMEFDDFGNLSYVSSEAVFTFYANGSIGYTQISPTQQMVVEADGALLVESEQMKYYKRSNGDYYSYRRGVEPGSFSEFKSLLDNVKDIFRTTTTPFEEEDGEETEWEQLLKYELWVYHEQYDYTTNIHFIKQYDADGNIVSEDIYNPDGSHSHVITDADGNKLSEEVVNPDGSRSLVNKDAEGKVLLSRTIGADGALSINIGDGSYTLGITATGAVTETQKGAKSITSDDTVELASTAGSLVTIGNSVSTLGEILGSLCDALTALHTEGSPAAHTASAWATTDITPIKTKIGQVFG